MICPRLISILLGLCLTAGAAACAPTASSGVQPSGPGEAGVDSRIRLVISRDYGQTVFSDRQVAIAAGTNSMSALQQVAGVDTAYGGSFVEAIDDLRSGFTGSRGSQEDWFFYINGLISNTGALDYPLHNGDVEQWDFHNWSFRQLIPAMIGHFPQPFTGGSRGRVFETRVIYDPGWEKEAGEICDYLKQTGVEKVHVRPSDQISEDEKNTCNLIILGPPSNQWLAELNKQWKRLGFFAYFDDSKLSVIDSAGQVKSEYLEKTGVIQATQNPWNLNGIGAGETTLWMISGCDTTGIRLAVECCLKNGGEWKNSYAVVVKPEQTIKLP